MANRIPVESKAALAGAMVEASFAKLMDSTILSNNERSRRSLRESFEVIAETCGRGEKIVSM